MTTSPAHRLSAPLAAPFGDAARAWKTASPLARVVLICLGAGFLLAPLPVWSLVFYLGVAPFCLARFWRDRSLDWCGGYAVLALALIAWSALTLLWGQDPGHNRVSHFLIGSACTAVFLVAMLIALRENARHARILGGVMIGCGAVNAVLSIALFIGLRSGVSPRLEGWGETRQGILGATIIGACLIFTLARAMSERRGRWPLTLIAALLLCFIVLTGSRGPLGAALAASLLLVARGSWMHYLRALLLVVVAAAAWDVLAPDLAHHLVANIAERGASHRPEIWRQAIEQIEERPWFGWGLAANLGATEFTFPHSLYLSALFYSGIVGFSLMMALIVAVVVGLLRRPDIADRRLLLALIVNALISGLTDLGQISNGPGPLWYIFWLPIILAIDALTRPAPAPLAPYETQLMSVGQG